MPIGPLSFPTVSWCPEHPWTQRTHHSETGNYTIESSMKVETAVRGYLGNNSYMYEQDVLILCVCATQVQKEIRKDLRGHGDASRDSGIGRLLGATDARGAQAP